jgi:hypothetical protein
MLVARANIEAAEEEDNWNILPEINVEDGVGLDSDQLKLLRVFWYRCCLRASNALHPSTKTGGLRTTEE